MGSSISGKTLINIQFEKSKRSLLTTFTFLHQVACILIVPPVESRMISKLANLKTAAVGTVSDIASIVPNVIRAKGSAVLQAAARAANIAAVGAGLKGLSNLFSVFYIVKKNALFRIEINLSLIVVWEFR